MKNVFFEGEHAVRKPLCSSIPEGIERLVGDRSVFFYSLGYITFDLQGVGPAQTSVHT